MAEVNPTLAAKLIEKGLELLLPVRALRHATPVDEFHQQRAKLVELGDDVDRARRQRQRHFGEVRRLRILNDDRPARGLHRPRACRSVVPHAGENHPDQAIAVNPRRGAEEEIDRGQWALRPVRDQAYLLLRDLDVPVRGDHEDHPWLQRQPLVPGKRAHRQGRPTVEDRFQVARPLGVEMLVDDDGRRKIYRQRGDNRRQRFDPASG